VVTVGIDDHGVVEIPDGPAPARVGVLVLRVWLEGTAGDPVLRIGLTGRHDITRTADETASASTARDALAYVRDWLTRFQAPPGDEAVTARKRRAGNVSAQASTADESGR
jgi:hypothetical protein